LDSSVVAEKTVTRTVTPPQPKESTTAAKLPSSSPKPKESIAYFKEVAAPVAVVKEAVPAVVAPVAVKVEKEIAMIERKESPKDPIISTREVSRHSSKDGALVPTTTTVMTSRPLEWVQCETCKKWRKLPSHIAASSLGDTWFCTMNDWQPALANCSVPEDVAENPLEESASSAVANAGAAPTRSTTPTMPATEGGGANVGKRGGLPQGINLYGGQVQSQQVIGAGQKASRVLSYRDLIGVHYRHHRALNPAFNATCDTRYAPFSAYVSPSSKSISFENKCRLWSNASSSSSSTISSISSSSISNEENNRSARSLPPKKKQKMMLQC